MSLFHKIKAAEYLASEFLTWLLYRSEVQDGQWRSLDDRPSFELWPDDRLRLEAPIDGITRDLLSGGSPSVTPEARSALAAGKVVQEARWKMVREDREWLFTLKAPDLDLRSVRLPALLTAETDDRLRERISLMEILEQVLEGLYGQFLRLRLGAAWDREELPKIAEWILQGDERQAA